MLIIAAPATHTSIVQMQVRSPPKYMLVHARPVLDPYSTRTRPVLDPYSTRPILDPYSTRKPVFDPYSTRTQSVLDPYSARTQSVLDPYSTRTRSVLDAYSSVLDPYSTRTRSVLDPYSTRTGVTQLVFQPALLPRVRPQGKHEGVVCVRRDIRYLDLSRERERDPSVFPSKWDPTERKKETAVES